MTAHADASSLSVSDLKRRGLMLILSSPPGGGKTTISRAICEADKYTQISVSATTRDQRPGENEGEHYYFVSQDKFKEMVDAGEMLEHAVVYNGQSYGTPKAPVETAIAKGHDVIFDIDWQGMRQLKSLARDDIVSVFLLPPTWADLGERLHGRKRDSEAEIERRLGKAYDEIAHYKEFDYIIVNRDLNRSIAKVKAILQAERLKRVRLTNLDEFVAALKP